MNTKIQSAITGVISSESQEQSFNEEELTTRQEDANKIAKIYAKTKKSQMDKFKERLESIGK